MYRHYLRAFTRIEAMRKELTNPVVDKPLRLATAKNLLAIMRLRGIPVSHRPAKVDLFTFAIAYDQLVISTTFDIPHGIVQAIHTTRRLRPDEQGN